MRLPRIHGLTAKQWITVRLVAEGMKNAEVAKMVGTTDFCIKNYLRDIFDITGMGNREELALWYAARHRRRQEHAKPELKPSEWQVARLLLQGCNNKEIGTSLHIKLRTVKNRLSILFRRYSITSGIKRVKLIVLLYPLFHKESL